MPENLENSAVATGLEKVRFHSNSKEIPGLISFRMDWLDLLAVQGTLNYRTIALISHASKVMLKILQASIVCEP